MKTISLTIPLDYFALTRASDMLHGLALDLENEGKQKARTDADEVEATPTDAIPAVSGNERPAAEVFGTPGKPNAASTATEPEISTPSACDAVAPQESAASTSLSAEAPNEPAQPALAAASPGTAPEATGVELDSDGLPWDHRIHSGSKGKLAKTQQWKKKRGVDPEEVTRVEAELRAAMSASPAAPIEPAAPAPAPAPQASAPAAPTSAITTFPALMQRITGEGIPAADVTAAVNKQGLAALPLLAARPDLIPAVAAELFPGG